MTDTDNLSLADRIRIAAELLESLDADRAQLTQVSEEEQYPDAGDLAGEQG